MVCTVCSLGFGVTGITSGIRKSIEVKNIPFQTDDFAKYKFAEIVTAFTRLSKKNYSHDSCSKNVNKRITWNGINNVINCQSNEDLFLL